MYTKSMRRLGILLSAAVFFWGVIALAKITVGITAGAASPEEIAAINNKAVDDAIRALEDYRNIQDLPVADQLSMQPGSRESDLGGFVFNIPGGRLGEVLEYFQEFDFPKGGQADRALRKRLKNPPFAMLEPFPMTDLDAYMNWASLDGKPLAASEFAKIIPNIYYTDSDAAIEALHRYPYAYNEDDRKEIFELTLAYEDVSDLQFEDNFAATMDEIQLATGDDYIDLSGEFGTRLLKSAIIARRAHAVEYLLSHGARIENEKGCIEEVDLDGGSLQAGPVKQIESVSQALLDIWNNCQKGFLSHRGLEWKQLSYLKDQSDLATKSHLEQCFERKKKSKRSEILEQIPRGERNEIWKIVEETGWNYGNNYGFFFVTSPMRDNYLKRYCAKDLARSWFATEEIKEMIHPKKKEEVKKAPRIQVVRNPKKKKIGKCDLGLLKTQLDNAVDRLEDYDVATAGGTGECTYIVQRKSGEIQITRYNFTENSIKSGASQQKGAR